MIIKISILRMMMLPDADEDETNDDDDRDSDARTLEYQRVHASQASYTPTCQDGIQAAPGRPNIRLLGVAHVSFVLQCLRRIERLYHGISMTASKKSIHKQRTCFMNLT